MGELKSSFLIRLENFDIAAIANSGQCFRLNPHPTVENKWRLIAFGKVLDIYQVPGNEWVSFSCSKMEWDGIWARYFDCEVVGNQRYENALKLARGMNDELMSNAVDAGKGIRVLNQAMYEASISFLISQNNNIPRIKAIIEKMCRKLGRYLGNIDGQECYAFPMIETLTEENLEDMGLGYRLEYIVAFAEHLREHPIYLTAIAKCDNDGLRKELLRHKGIGPKVADCIMLFGYHRLDVTPIDTWMSKVFNGYYKGRFPMERFYGYQGIIQQYLFNYVVNNKGALEECRQKRTITSTLP